MKKILELQKKIIPNYTILKIIYLGFLGVISFHLNKYAISVFIGYSMYAILRDGFPQKDKLEHFYMALIYTLIGMIWLTGWAIILPSLILAISKEARDYFDEDETTHFEVADLFFTVLSSIMIDRLVIYLNLEPMTLFEYIQEHAIFILIN